MKQTELENIDATLWNHPRSERLQKWLIDNGHLDRGHNPPRAIKYVTTDLLASGKLTAEKFSELIGLERKEKDMTTTAQKLFAQPTNIRVRPAGDGYSEKRPTAKHKKTGQPVFDAWGEEVSRPSQLTLAKSGAYLKFAARKAGIQVDWTEHDQALLTQTIETDEWASFAGEPGQCKIFGPGAVKAPLLDDATSGGIEAAPIVFDTDVIVTPLLTGELLPMVDLKPISRGRRIEASSIGHPSVVWNQGDAAVGDIFDSTSQIAALDSTVFDLSCHVLIGRNFLSDAAIDVGSILIPLIGERMAEALEQVISEGDGLTQPQGVKAAAGTTSVSFASAAATTAKYLELLFSTPKNLRDSSYAFAGNEVSYRRARSIVTGIAGDTTLINGPSVESYTLFDRPYKIVPNLANSEILAGSWKRYRLYQRLGSAVEWSTQGENLQRRNEALLTVRQRWAGRPMIASAFSVITNAEA